MIRSTKARLVVPLAALVAALGACAENSAGPERGIELEWVAENDASILGETGTISGEVAEVLGPRSIRLGNPENVEAQVLALSGAQEFDDIGVLAEQSLVGRAVEVTGEIRELDVAGFEDEFGVDWDQELAEEVDGEYVMIAEEISLLNEED